MITKICHHPSNILPKRLQCVDGQSQECKHERQHDPEELAHENDHVNAGCRGKKAEQQVFRVDFDLVLWFLCIVHCFEFYGANVVKGD